MRIGKSNIWNLILKNAYFAKLEWQTWVRIIQILVWQDNFLRIEDGETGWRMLKKYSFVAAGRCTYIIYIHFYLIRKKRKKMPSYCGHFRKPRSPPGPLWTFGKKLQFLGQLSFFQCLRTGGRPTLWQQTSFSTPFQQFVMSLDCVGMIFWVTT